MILTGKRKIIRRRRAPSPSPSRWSDLPSDSLRLIAGNLTNNWDYASFNAVCSSWRSATNPADRPIHIPYLLLPYNLDSTYRSFLHPTDRSIHTVNLPESFGKRLYGAPRGWLVMLGRADPRRNPKTYTVSLLNPLTRSHISLPLLSTGRMSLPNHVGDNIFAYSIKTALSANPASYREEVVIALMIYSRLAICKLGGESWTFVQLRVGGAPLDFMVDIAYFDRAFYVVDIDEGITIVDIATMKKKYSASASPSTGLVASTFHLVVSSGDLLLLERNTTWHETAIRIFKLDRSSRRVKWARIGESIGDRALFVSQNHSSVSVLSHGFAGGGRRDVICYAAADSSNVNDSTICISDIVAGSSVMHQPHCWKFPRTDPTYDDDLNGLVWIVPNPC